MNGDFGKETYFPTPAKPSPFPILEPSETRMVSRHALRPSEKYGWFLYTHERPIDDMVAFLEIDGCSRYANLFWYGQRHGGVCIIWGPLPGLRRVFQWGCEHKKAHSTRMGIHFSKYTCDECTAVWEVDSSG